MLPLSYFIDVSDASLAENINYNKMWAAVEIKIL